MTSDPIAYRIRTEDVSHERLDGEVIAIHLRTGRYYSISGSAADVWSLMDSGTPRDTWIPILERAFSGGAIDGAHLDAFVDLCVQQGLVEEAPAGGGRFLDRLPDDYARPAWVAPFIEEFDDMQDLILVDPVHDTSMLGWPYTPVDDD